MSFASPFPDVDIPDVSVYESLFGDVEADAQSLPALIDSATGETVTYRALFTGTQGVGRAGSGKASLRRTTENIQTNRHCRVHLF